MGSPNYWIIINIDVGKEKCKESSFRNIRGREGIVSTARCVAQYTVMETKWMGGLIAKVVGKNIIERFWDGVNSRGTNRDGSTMKEGGVGVLC